MSYCKDCGKELLYKGADYCQHCGKAQFEESPPEVEEVEQEIPVKKLNRATKVQRTEVRIIRTVSHKSPGTAALIAFVGAIFGFPGIGHIYVGRIGRGIGILVAGFLLYIMMWITFLGAIIGGGLAAATGGGSAGFLAGGTVAVMVVLLYLGLLVWQIFNARSVAKQHNEKAERIAMNDTEAA
ncbi:MAG TPA: hypothetical protein VIB07_02020 [Nitrososphaera sp.]